MKEKKIRKKIHLKYSRSEFKEIIFPGNLTKFSHFLFQIAFVNPGVYLKSA